MMKPLVLLAMSRASDWDILQHAGGILRQFGVSFRKAVKPAIGGSGAPAQVLIVSEPPKGRLAGAYAQSARRPVLQVPLPGSADSPGGVVAALGRRRAMAAASFAIGKAGAINAALFAVSILALTNPPLRRKLERFRSAQTRKVLKDRLS